MNEKRRQLTLFVNNPNSLYLEEIRKEFNPKQFELIKCHVTLCRDEELDQLDLLLRNLRNLNGTAFSLKLGQVKRFSEGKGVLIPIDGSISEFENLRKMILQGIIPVIKNLQPHITLMHPRNSKCTDVIFERISKLVFPQTIEFNKISLIEQIGECKWNVVEEYDLF